MKPLHIIDSGGLYGAEIMLLNLMEEQQRLGLYPILASIGDPNVGEKPLESEARRRGLRVETFRMRPGLNLAGAADILRFARNEAVELLHSHGYKGNILFGLMPRSVRKLPLVSTVHGWTWTGGFSRMMVYEWLDGVSLRFIDRVILVNGAMAKHPRLRRVPSGRVRVVENGIHTELPPPSTDEDGLSRRIVDFCRGGQTLIAAGRLSHEKGYDLLIEAFSLLAAERHDLRLLILGEGELRGQLEERVASLGRSENVFMPGYVADAWRFYGPGRLFVLPSRTEGLPMVLLEAMAAGIPIVAARVGGIPHVLAEGAAGLLVKPEDSAALADGIAALLDNEGQAAAFTAAAAQRVTAHFSSRTMAEKYLATYQNIIQQPRKGNERFNESAT